MERLIYVSESNLEETEADAVVAQMVANSQSRNAQLNLTGALIFTGTHFAQVLEGCKTAIDEVMTSIQRDRRHGAVTIVDRSPISERQFLHWAMAYQGPSQFILRHVTRLMHTTPGTEQKMATEWLTQLAREFLKP